jgi:hypothetical protein
VRQFRIPRDWNKVNLLIERNFQAQAGYKVPLFDIRVPTNMSSNETDPENSSIIQLQKSSGNNEDTGQKVEAKDTTMQLLAKMLGEHTQMEVDIVTT